MRLSISLGDPRLRHLFSENGRDELKSIVASHIVMNRTLYSDAYYGRALLPVGLCKSKDTMQYPKARLCPRGTRHFELSTLESGVSQTVTIYRFTRLIRMLIDDLVFVSHPNIIAMNGVVHLVHSLLLS